MASVADLVVRLTAETKGLTGPLSKAKSDLDGLGDSSIKSTGKLGGLADKFRGLGPIAQGAVLGAGTAVAGLAVAGVNAFGDFEKGMSEVFTLMPGLSKDAMGAMSDDVRDLSKEMGLTTSETVPALYQAISAGVPSDNVFDFMEVASKAAIGGVTDLETAVDGITSATNAYGIENLSAQEAADKMFTAVKLGKTNFEQLSGALFQVAPIAAGMGVSFDDVTAALAALTSQGVPTSVASTQIRQAIAELGKEGSKAFDTFKEATGKTFPQFISEGGNLQEAFAAMGGAADDQGTAVQNLFGSIEAGQAVLALTSKSGGPAFVKAMGEMEKSAGAVDEAFTTMSESQNFKMDQMKAQVGDALIGIGEALAPLVNAVLPLLTDLLGALTPIIAGVGDALGFVAKVAAPVVGILGDVTGVLMEWGTPLGLAKKGIGALSDAFDTSGRAAGDAEDALIDLGGRVDSLTTRELRDAVAEFSKYEARIGDSSTALDDLQETLGLSDDAYGDHIRKVIEMKDEYGLNKDRVKELEDQLHQLDQKALNAEWASHYAGYAEAFKASADNVTESSEKMGEDWATLAAAAEEEYAAQMIDALSGLDEAAVESGIAMGKWEEELDASLQDAVSAFHKLPEAAKISVDEMMTNMSESIEHNRRWKDALVALGDAGLTALRDEIQSHGSQMVEVAEQVLADPMEAAILNMALGPKTNDQIWEVLNKLNMSRTPVSQAARGLLSAVGIVWDQETNRWVSEVVGAEQEIRMAHLRLDGMRSTSSHTHQIITQRIEQRITQSFNAADNRAFYADGGFVRSGEVAVVGERGPELAVFSQAAEIIPNHKVADWLSDNRSDHQYVYSKNGRAPSGGAGGRERPLHVHLEVDGRELAEVVLDQQAMAMARNGV